MGMRWVALSLRAVQLRFTGQSVQFGERGWHTVAPSSIRAWLSAAQSSVLRTRVSANNKVHFAEPWPWDLRVGQTDG